MRAVSPSKERITQWLVNQEQAVEAVLAKDKVTDKATNFQELMNQTSAA